MEETAAAVTAPPPDAPTAPGSLDDIVERWWADRTDVTGSGIGPDQFGILQDVQIEWDWQTKELWGQFQFPVDIARGQGKISGKAKFARIFGAIYGNLFFGQI